VEQAGGIAPRPVRAGFLAGWRRRLAPVLDPAQIARLREAKNRRKARGVVMSSVRALRPVRDAVPALPEFESLDRTHRAALGMLAAFEKLLDHVDEHGPDATARAAAQEVMAFFGGPGLQHHAEEELHVFPTLLASRDPELVGHVRRLQQDHGWIEEDWRELEPQVESIAKGYNWYQLSLLRAALPVFTALYREHIALEEVVVYPAAKQLQHGMHVSRAAREAGA
jgi:hemerythrin-like domain-containing protein